MLPEADKLPTPMPLECPHRHCERSEAIRGGFTRPVDCRVTALLAMTIHHALAALVEATAEHGAGDVDLLDVDGAAGDAPAPTVT